MQAVRAALEQRLKNLESELHQVERLQRKFVMIHSTLAQQQSGSNGTGSRGSAAAAGEHPDTPKLRASEENPLNVSRSSLPGGMKASQDLGKLGAKLASSLELNKGQGRPALASMR